MGKKKIQDIPPGFFRVVELLHRICAEMHPDVHRVCHSLHSTLIHLHYLLRGPQARLMISILLPVAVAQRKLRKKCIVSSLDLQYVVLYKTNMSQSLFLTAVTLAHEKLTGNLPYQAINADCKSEIPICLDRKLTTSFIYSAQRVQ